MAELHHADPLHSALGYYHTGGVPKTLAPEPYGTRGGGDHTAALRAPYAYAHGGEPPSLPARVCRRPEGPARSPWSSPCGRRSPPTAWRNTANRRAPAVSARSRHGLLHC